MERATFAALLVLSTLVALSSETELVDRLRRRSSYGMSACLLNCEAGLLECSLNCFLEAPMDCLTNCFLRRGGVTDAMGNLNECAQQCAGTILDCLDGCDSNGDSGSYRRSAHLRAALRALPTLAAAPVH
ncbi:hypothetical protein SAY87_006088 [Trapa incisa]|uniref:Uncharacterized protein n=1 Tax=Trapa incisa TaxID=236973 RepID=A0AAN7QCP9_9MYRT|nr:hypothetical protein SAY87_006088 [Trapa incisa]